MGARLAPPWAAGHLGCGEDGILALVRRFLGRRFGPLKIQETNLTHVGVELTQAKGFLCAGAQEGVYGRASTDANLSGDMGIASTSLLDGRDS